MVGGPTLFGAVPWPQATQAACSPKIDLDDRPSDCIETISHCFSAGMSLTDCLRGTRSRHAGQRTDRLYRPTVPGIFL